MESAKESGQFEGWLRHSIKLRPLLQSWRRRNKKFGALIRETQSWRRHEKNNRFSLSSCWHSHFPPLPRTR